MKNKLNLSLRMHAIGDLLKRYGKIFRLSWEHRKETDTVKRLPHEAAFLPAGLSLQETPVSPTPRVVMWALIGFAVIALLWATFGHVDVVAVGQGKIIPNDHSKTIQSIETANVTAIHVVDGQSVKAGDALIDLDATIAQADIQRTKDDLFAMQLQVARAQALLLGTQTGHIGKLSQSPTLAHLPPQKIGEAQQQVDGAFAEYQAKMARIHANIAKNEAELRSTQALVKKIEHTLPLTRQRAQDYQSLLDEHFVTQHAASEKTQNLIEQEGDLAYQRSRLKEIEATLSEAKGQRISLIAETRRIALDSTTETQQKIANLTQELNKATVHGKRMRLTAPVDGLIQQLAVHTVGGVVTPAQALMIIVPKDRPLEIEAFLENKDIGFIHAGQEAEVKVETFPYTKFGTLHATVSHVSHDAINDEKRGLIYSTRIKMDKTTIDVNGHPTRLTPGMAVTVEIKTAKRRVINYFLSPLLKHQQESFRER